MAAAAAPASRVLNTASSLAEAGTVRRPFAIALLLLGSSSVACEGRDGDANDFTVPYVATDGGFRFDYVTPPWRVQSENDRSIELRIDPELFGFGLDGSPPTHVFRMGYVESPEELSELLDIPIDFGTDSIPLNPFDSGTSAGFDPRDLPETDGETDTDGIPETDGTEWLPDGIDPDEVPDYLLDLDLSSARDVALAEFRLLVDRQNAQVDEPLQFYETQSGQLAVVYQVVLDPGVFVRAYYFRGRDVAVRAVYASLFNLKTDDIARMAQTMSTAAASGEAP